MFSFEFSELHKSGLRQSHQAKRAAQKKRNAQRNSKNSELVE